MVDGGWIITRDLVADNKMYGYSHGRISYRMMKYDGVPFRLYDGDGIMYFEGLINENWIYGEAELAFAPLDWAMDNFGCTSMTFFNGEEWEEL